MSQSVVVSSLSISMMEDGAGLVEEGLSMRENDVAVSRVAGVVVILNDDDAVLLEDPDAPFLEDVVLAFVADGAALLDDAGVQDAW
jgi:hypothetical protein